jgi:hypothetical protein
MHDTHVFEQALLETDDCVWPVWVGLRSLFARWNPALFAPITSPTVLADAAATALFAGWPDGLVFACAGTTAIYAGVRPATMDAKQLCGTFFAILFSPGMRAQTFPTTLGATITLPPMGAKAIPATLEASGALHLVNALAVRFHWNVCHLLEWAQTKKSDTEWNGFNGAWHAELALAPLMLGDRIMLMLWNAMNCVLATLQNKVKNAWSFQLWSFGNELRSSLLCFLST